MGKRDIIVVGGSAGAIGALHTLVNGLPADFPGSIFVVIHMSPWHESALDCILRRGGKMAVVQARDGQKIERSTIYVASADHHLLIEDGEMVLAKGPKEHRHRPAIDPLFRSAALHFGPRTVGIILSGMLDDGASGLWQIKRAGGLAVVQDPRDALQPQMPQNAIDNVDVDHVVAASEMHSLLKEAVKSGVGKGRKPPKKQVQSMNVEERITRMDDGLDDIRRIAKPSQYTCPDCAGTLYEMREGQMVRYRCRTGHAYAELALMAGQRVNVEDMLWAAMRGLREKSELLQQRAKRRRNGDPSHTRLLQLAQRAEKQAKILRDMIETLDSETGEGEERGGGSARPRPKRSPREERMPRAASRRQELVRSE